MGWSESTLAMEITCCGSCMLYHRHYLGLVVREPAFGVSNQVRLKPVCSTAETSYNIEILHE